MYTIDKSKSQSIIYYKEWGNVYTYTLDSPIYMYMYFIYIIMKIVFPDCRLVWE